MTSSPRVCLHSCIKVLFHITGWYIQVVYQLFLAIYIVELMLRMYAWRLKFFKNWWDVFSKCHMGSGLGYCITVQCLCLSTGLLLIVVDLVGLCVPLIVHKAGIFDTRIFQVLRVLKIVTSLRALRVIRTIR